MLLELEEFLEHIPPNLLTFLQNLYGIRRTADASRG